MPITSTNKTIIINQQQQQQHQQQQPIPINVGDGSKGLLKLLNNNRIVNPKSNVLFVSDTKPNVFEPAHIKKPSSSLSLSFASAMKVEIMNHNIE
jgi:hypothetical protein